MENKTVASDKADNSSNANKNSLSSAYARFKLIPITHRVVGGALLGVVVLGALAYFLPYMKERMKFFTDAALSWLIFVIVAVQAYIYNKQREVMQKQTDNFEITERAYVGIKDMTLKMKTGSNLAVVIVCQNGGRTPAWDVNCTARLSIDVNDVKDPPQLKAPTGAFFLPANFKKYLSISFGLILTDQAIKWIEDGAVPVIVVGEITYKDFRRKWRQRYPFTGIYDIETRKFKQYDKENK
jgi:hypothetical protein